MSVMFQGAMTTSPDVKMAAIVYAVLLVVAFFVFSTCRGISAALDENEAARRAGEGNTDER